MSDFNFTGYFESETSLEVIDSDTYELNIQPPASIFNVFSRLSYKPWYAIAEFVDNSTQSYITNEGILKSLPEFSHLIVEINYNSAANTLIITDNAFGMEIDKFKDAILLDSRNSEQQGRNEFGMGLKTAASWFGNVWSVTSTQYGSINEYSATVNVPELKNRRLNSTIIHRKNTDMYSHGTEIKISDVTKKINAPNTIKKIREVLSSMYRRDINERNIEIRFNNDPVEFKEYQVLRNFRGKVWRKSLDFIVSFENKDYRVTGFVGILENGGFGRAGFALFRQDRVVIGGDDQNYKPDKIFGQSQSPISHKLFGELDMNDFPVNQAKDGFIWDDGLEDIFIEKLKENIQEYINIAKMTNKERAKECEFSEQVSDEIQRKVSQYVQNLNAVEALDEAEVDFGSDDISQRQNKDNCIYFDDIHTPTQTDLEEYVETVLNAQDNEINQHVGSDRNYKVKINSINSYNFKVKWEIGTKDYWIDVIENSDEIDVAININHPFFKPYSREEDFKLVLEKFVIAFVVAEQQAKATSSEDGYILASTIRNKMNSYLSIMGGETDGKI
ncbi:MAG: ATP-binding protein [Bacillota bacterium]